MQIKYWEHQKNARKEQDHLRQLAKKKKKEQELAKLYPPDEYQKLDAEDGVAPPSKSKVVYIRLWCV